MVGLVCVSSRNAITYGATVRGHGGGRHQALPVLRRDDQGRCDRVPLLRSRPASHQPVSVRVSCVTTARPAGDIEDGRARGAIRRHRGNASRAGDSIRGRRSSAIFRARSSRPRLHDRGRSAHHRRLPASSGNRTLGSRYRRTRRHASASCAAETRVANRTRNRRTPRRDPHQSCWSEQPQTRRYRDGRCCGRSHCGRDRDRCGTREQRPRTRDRLLSCSSRLRGTRRDR